LEGVDAAVASSLGKIRNAEWEIGLRPMLDFGCWVHSEFKIAHSKFGLQMPMGTSAFRIGMLDSFRIQKSHAVGGELDD
jgi:hypothetical protein